MVKEVEFTDEVKAALLPAFGDEAAFIENQIINKVCQVWLYDGCGYFVTRLEMPEDAPECLVVVAGAGKNLNTVFEYLTKIADLEGFTMRVHSARFGMGRMLKPFGFEMTETIFKRGQYGRFV